MRERPEQPIDSLLAQWAAKAPTEDAARKPEVESEGNGEEPEQKPASPRELRERLERIRRARLRRARERLEMIRKARAKKAAPRARSRLAEFVRQGWEQIHPGTPLEWNWHLEVICDHCQHLVESLLEARENPAYEMPDQDFLINVPPRSLKTEIVGVFLPAWVWLRDPRVDIRYISGNERVRNKASRMSRQLVGSKWYRESFGVKWSIKSDVDAISLYQNTEGGERHSSTYKAGITGEGTDIIINDDPIDASDANSEVQRVYVNDRWDTAVESRVNDENRCLRIGIMQRLHEEDWSGFVLQKPNWRHVCIPMEFELERECKCADCQAGGVSFLGKYDRRTEEGELLHPERSGPKQIKKWKAKGEYFYAGQYQQRPSPAEGGMFKKSFWGWYTPGEEPRFRRTVIVVDCNYKKTVTGSRTSIQAWGEAGRYRYMLDNVTRSMDPPEMVREIKKMRARYPKSSIYIEEKAAGGPVIAQLRDEGIGGIVAFDPGHDSKESRAWSILGIVEAGDVLLPIGAAWVDDFIYETAVFPNGAHDDQVDGLSMALVYLRGAKTLKRTKL